MKDDFNSLDRSYPPHDTRVGYGGMPPGHGGAPPEARTGPSGVSPETRTGFSETPPEVRPGFSGAPPETRAGFSGAPPETRPGFSGAPPETRAGFSGEPPETRTEYGWAPPETRVGYGGMPHETRAEYGHAPITPQPTYKKSENRNKTSVGAIIVALMCGMLLMLGAGFIGLQIGRLDQNTATEAISDYAEDTPQISENDFVAVAEIIDRELSPMEVYALANPAVVAINTESAGTNFFGMPVTRPAAGSGFLISEDGLVVTNEHVIRGANSISVIMYDGTLHEAALLGEDDLTDLAVLRIDATDLTYLTFCDSSLLNVGKRVAAIGNPLGVLENSMTVGYISALDREINVEGIPLRMLQTDAAINGGNSGGPLINMQGRVIGVVTAKSVGTGIEGLGFAIPSNQAVRITDDLINHGMVTDRAAMGVSLETRYFLGLLPSIAVDSVVPGSGADRAGIQAGDIILAANERQLRDSSELRIMISEHSPGDVLRVDVQRGTERLILDVVLDQVTVPVNN